jgi:hypothetical protein
MAEALGRRESQRGSNGKSHAAQFGQGKSMFRSNELHGKSVIRLPKPEYTGGSIIASDSRGLCRYTSQAE